MCSRLPGCYKLITDITNLTQSQITVFLNTNAFLRIIIEMTPEYACTKITEKGSNHVMKRIPEITIL